MSDRPQLTPAQLSVARAALDELRAMYVARLDFMQSAIGLVLVLDGSALPVPAALESPAAFDSIAALGEAIDQQAELIQRAQVVEPEPLRAAA